MQQDSVAGQLTPSSKHTVETVAEIFKQLQLKEVFKSTRLPKRDIRSLRVERLTNGSYLLFCENR